VALTYDNSIHNVSKILAIFYIMSTTAVDLVVYCCGLILVMSSWLL